MRHFSNCDGGQIEKRKDAVHNILRICDEVRKSDDKKVLTECRKSLQLLRISSAINVRETSMRRIGHEGIAVSLQPNPLKGK